MGGTWEQGTGNDHVLSQDPMLPSLISHFPFPG